MCGITGFVGTGDRDDLVAMTTSLTHRGPDGGGYLVDIENATYLGHRRLAILDIAGGSQPMFNENRTIAVIYNGEIYNHVDLKAELQRKGHIFNSDHSDTEILVHGYEEWGTHLPERLNGMFAFAIYDKPKRRLFLARDRFGEKPLYYFDRDGFFGFASELRAFKQHQSFNASLDYRALQKLFAYGFVPAPNACYRGCHKLPGGHSLTYNIGTRAIEIDAYWRFQIEPDESLTNAHELQLVEELRHLLSQAVRRRLVSDVPLGLFLSGGIDSSTILALAARGRTAGNVKTFTVGFDVPSYDESSFAQSMADFIGSEHHQQTLSLDRARELLTDVLARLDEPLGDPSIVPTYLLSKFTRDHVTVALSGDGGDELFAGYDPFRALTPATLYSRLVGNRFHRGLRRMTEWLPLSTRNMSFDFKLRRTLTGLTYPRELWNPIWLAPVEPIEMSDLFDEPLPIEELYEEAVSVWQRSSSRDIGDKTLEFYTVLYLQDGILAKVDRASMLCSLESRAVFLDNDVVNFCQRLPYRFKFRNGRGKYLLRKAMSGLVPREILNRPKKGFGIPAAAWLREVPRTPPLAPITGVDMSWVSRRWEEHRMGAADHRLFLWSWLSLQSVFAG
jgi:asparagine synthase (glutamine-hydrolysing)